MHPNQSAATRQRVFAHANRINRSDFYMFMTQALSADGSCRHVVNEAAVKRAIAGLPLHSASISAYCQARSRLPLSMITTSETRAGVPDLSDGGLALPRDRGRAGCRHRFLRGERQRRANPPAGRDSDWRAC